MVEELARPLEEQYINLTRERTLDPAKVLIFEIKDPEAIDAVALYNSAVILDDEEHTLVIMRLNTVGPQAGQPDITDRYTIVSIKKRPDSYCGATSSAYTVQHYSNVLIRKELQDLLPDLENLEDPRSVTLKDGKVMLGFAAVRDKVPYPALVTATPPFHKENFSTPEIIEGIPPGKNTCPLDENTFLYRKEGTGGNQTISVVKKVDNVWQIVKEINFPQNLSWANFKIGLGGGFLKDKLMILHGVNMSQSVKFIEENYEYAFGLARFEYDKDENGNPLYETLRLIEVSQDPLFTHSQMKTIAERVLGIDDHKELNGYKKVIYTCDAGIIEGNSVRLLVTFGDTRTFWAFLPKDYVLNFLEEPQEQREEVAGTNPLYSQAA